MKRFLSVVAIVALLLVSGVSAFADGCGDFTTICIGSHCQPLPAAEGGE